MVGKNCINNFESVDHVQIGSYLAYDKSQTQHDLVDSSTFDFLPKKELFLNSPLFLFSAKTTMATIIYF